MAYPQVHRSGEPQLTRISLWTLWVSHDALWARLNPVFYADKIHQQELNNQTIDEVLHDYSNRNTL